MKRSRVGDSGRNKSCRLGSVGSVGWESGQELHDSTTTSTLTRAVWQKVMDMDKPERRESRDSDEAQERKVARTL
jgi:hypothetical protein